MPDKLTKGLGLTLLLTLLVTTSVYAFPRTVTDQLGHTVDLDQAPQRIVSIAPSNTEILYALELQDRLVGVTEYCDYPLEAKEKEKIGGFSDPSIEKIIALAPDLVLANEGVQTESVNQLLDLGITVLTAAYAQDVTDVYSIIEFIGEAKGRSEAATELITGMEQEINEVHGTIADHTTERPSVFFEIWHDPIMTVGPKSFISDLIWQAGGENVVSDVQDEYPQYSLEKLIEDDPDVYIASEGHMSSPGEVSQREGWKHLTAVEEDRVYLVDEDLINRTGPRITEGISKLARAIHPQAF